MSRKPRNNHYHYAEKFDKKNRRMRASDLLKAPKKAFTLALLVLLAFGLISTTFAAYVSSDDFTASQGALILNVRNTLAEREGTGLAGTAASADIASTGSYTDVRYNSNSKGWGTSGPSFNSNGWLQLTFASQTAESFKLYHNSWGQPYFSKSSSSVSLNTEYSLHNNSSTGQNYGNMSYTFAADSYAIKIANPDTYNDMKMTIYRLFPTNSYYYLDTTGYWDSDNPVIGAYFCDSTSNTDEWVKAEPCADVSNSHMYRVQSPSSTRYSKIVWGRFKTGTTQSQMNFTLDGSGGYMWNQSADQYYQAANTIFKMTSTGTGTSTKATVTTSSTAHTHKYYAYEVSRTSSTGAYSTTKKTISSGTTLDCTAAGPVLTATDRSSEGYTFDGWYRGTTSGASNATTLVPALSGQPLKIQPTNYSGDSYYYAKYTLSSFDVSYSGYGNSLNSSDTEEVYYGSRPANVPNTDANGYTFLYWKKSSDASTEYSTADVKALSVTSDLDFTAYYDIDAPAVSISDAQHTAGGTATTLTASATSNASGITPTKAFEIIAGPTGAILPGNSGANCAITSAGVFTASIPGTYTVRLTGTATNANTVNGSASASDTCTVTVYPAKPNFSVTLTGKADEEGRDGTTQEKAYKIMLGSTYSFSASVNDPIAGYTYKWSLDGTTWDDFTGAAAPYVFDSYTSATGTNDAIAFASVEALESIDPTTFELYLKAEMNGQSAEADKATVHYFIQPLIKEFNFVPFQKVYNALYPVSINAKYNLDNADGYTTTMYFSADNGSYTAIQRKTGSFIESFADTLRNYFYPEGVKYFKMEITDGNLNSSVGPLHTTVGTANTDAVRPFYFINNVEGLDLTNKRVIAYWSDPDSSTGYRYQAAQDIYKGVEGKAEGKRYRINLPSNANDLVFAITNPDLYGTPTYSEGTFTFTNPSSETIYFLAATDCLALDTENCYTVTQSDGAALPTLSGTVSNYIGE